MLRSNFKSLHGLKQTPRLDYVPFLYYFCKFLLFNFNFFFSKQRMAVFTFMNFAKRTRKKALIFTFKRCFKYLKGLKGNITV